MRGVHGLIYKCVLISRVICLADMTCCNQSDLRRHA